MASALISPNETIIVGDVIGSRVAQVSVEEFIVAPPLMWVSCNNSIVADEWMYVGNLADEAGSFVGNRFVQLPDLATPTMIAPVTDPVPVIDILKEF